MFLLNVNVLESGREKKIKREKESYGGGQVILAPMTFLLEGVNSCEPEPTNGHLFRKFGS